MERSEVLEHMARTLFVSAFAGATEDREAFPDFDPRGQIPGSGGDWFDAITDPTPPQADAKAAEIAADFERVNCWPLEIAGEYWAATPGHCYRTDDDAEAFGFRLAMQALGHGVSLWDDVAEAPGFEVGLYEFYMWDCWPLCPLCKSSDIEPVNNCTSMCKNCLGTFHHAPEE